MYSLFIVHINNSYIIYVIYNLVHIILIYTKFMINANILFYKYLYKFNYFRLIFLCPWARCEEAETLSHKEVLLLVFELSPYFFQR